MQINSNCLIKKHLLRLVCPLTLYSLNNFPSENSIRTRMPKGIFPKYVVCSSRQNKIYEKKITVRLLRCNVFVIFCERYLQRLAHLVYTVTQITGIFMDKKLFQIQITLLLCKIVCKILYLLSCLIKCNCIRHWRSRLYYMTSALFKKLYCNAKM